MVKELQNKSRIYRPFCMFAEVIYVCNFHLIANLISKMLNVKILEVWWTQLLQQFHVVNLPQTTPV